MKDFIVDSYHNPKDGWMFVWITTCVAPDGYPVKTSSTCHMFKTYEEALKALRTDVATEARKIEAVCHIGTISRQWENANPTTLEFLKLEDIDGVEYINSDGLVVDSIIELATN